MKLVLSTIFIATLFSTHAQKKYIVTFDKLEDNFSYEEVIYDHGRESSHPIKKPKISYGDIVIVRAKNTNEFVFDMNVEQRQINRISENAAARLLSGFNPMLSDLGGRLGAVLSEFEYITSSTPDPIYGTRGDAELSESELFNLEISEKTIRAFETAKMGMTELKTLDKNINVIYAEDKTLNEIKKSFGTFSETFDMKSLLDRVDELNNILDEITMEIREPEFDLEFDLLKEIKTLNRSIDKINEHFQSDENPIDEDLFDNIQEELDAVDFEVEHVFVAQSSGGGWGGSGGTLEDINEIEYSIKFEKKSDEEDGWGNDENSDNLRMLRMVKLKTDSPNLPLWTTGIVFVSPFSGISNYTLERSEWLDSLYVSNVPDKSLIFSIATNLMYEFNVNSPVIPHVSVGMGLGILDENERKISFLLGGGIRFKAFSNLSLSGGISFVQNQVILEEFKENTWLEITEDMTDNWGDLEENKIFQTKFKPGYFFGINIHF